MTAIACAISINPRRGRGRLHFGCFGHHFELLCHPFWHIMKSGICFALEFGLGGEREACVGATFACLFDLGFFFGCWFCRACVGFLSHIFRGRVVVPVLIYEVHVFLKERLDPWSRVSTGSGFPSIFSTWGPGFSRLTSLGWFNPEMVFLHASFTSSRVSVVLNTILI